MVLDVVVVVVVVTVVVVVVVSECFSAVLQLTGSPAACSDLSTRWRQPSGVSRCCRRKRVKSPRTMMPSL